MSEVTNDYAISGGLDRGNFNTGLTGAAKAFADISARNSSDVRAEVPTNALISSLGNSNEHLHALRTSFDSNRDILKTESILRSDVKEEMARVLERIHSTELYSANGFKEILSEIKDQKIEDLRHQVASNSNSSLMSAIANLTTVVSGLASTITASA